MAGSSHLTYDPNSNSVSSYEPTIRAIDPGAFMDTVRAIQQQLAKAQALSASPTSVGRANTTNYQAGLPDSNVRKLLSLQSEQTKLKKASNNPDAFFKGKKRSELSPRLRALYDRQQKANKSTGIKTDALHGLAWVLDKLSRPNYAVAEGVSRVWEDSMKKHDNFLEGLGSAFIDFGKGAASGFMGHDKTNFAHDIQQVADSVQALKEGKDPNKVKYGSAHLGTAGKIAKGVGGFALDVLLDPTTYIGAGVVKAAIKTGETGVKTAAHAAQVDDVTNKLFDEYGVRLIKGAKPEHDAVHKAALRRQVEGGRTSDLSPHLTGDSGTAAKSEIVNVNKFHNTVKATVTAKETARFTEIFKAERAAEYRVVPTDEVATSTTKIMDVPAMQEDLVAHLKYTRYKGELGSRKAVLSKSLKEQQDLLTKARNAGPVGNAAKGSAGKGVKAGQQGAVYSSATTKAIERKISALYDEINKVDAEMARIDAKHADMFNISPVNAEAIAKAGHLANATKDPALEKQIAATRDRVRKLENKYQRIDSKHTKATKSNDHAPSHTDAKDLEAARLHLSTLLGKREDLRINAIADAAVKVAPDRGLLTAKVRRTSDIGIIKELSHATDVETVNTLRLELAYRFKEKGDKWLANVVRKASEHNDGLAEDLKNLTPLTRPAKHTIKRRQIVVEETPTKLADKKEIAAALRHNAKIDKEVTAAAERKAAEIADGITNTLREIMVRETSPNFKRGLALRLNVPFSSKNSPTTAKVLFALHLPDAVSTAVNKYVFRDTFKEGMAKYGAWFKSSAGKDPLLNEMRLSYNGGANYRIEYHADRLRHIWQDVKPSERQAALRQWLKYGTGGEGPYGELVTRIDDEIKRLTGAIHDNYPGGDSITLSDLNGWLPEKMKFQKPNSLDVKGLPEGTTEYFRASLRHMMEDTDPAEFLWNLNVAREKMLMRTMMKDNIREVFGIERNGTNEDLVRDLLKSGYKEVPELGKNHIFSPQLADDIVKTFDLMKNQREVNELIKFFDKAMTAYKSTVTMYNPGYHARNSFGDAWMNYLAGVAGIGGHKSYMQANKVMRAMRGLQDDNPVQRAILTADPLRAFQQLDVKPTTILWKGKKGNVTAEDVWVLYHQFGLHSGFVSNEFGTAFGKPGSFRATGLGQKVTGVNRKVQGLSESREDFFRMAHFIHVLRENSMKGGDLERAGSEAAASVRKYLFDYSDFTQVEKQVMLRVLPFYKWTRKAIPLMGETMFAQPGKALAYPKAMRNLSMALGYDMGDANGTIPASDVIIPEWIRQRGMYPLGEQTGNTVMGDIALPFNDVTRTVSSPIDSFFSMLTPAARIPVELKTGKRFYGNLPVGSKTSYAESSIPQTAFLQQLAKKRKAGDANGIDGTLMDPRTIQFLTGIGLFENTSRDMENELRTQATNSNKVISKRNKAARAKALKDLQNGN